MATQEARLKTITNNLEASYQALKRSSTNVAGLLQVGRATCEMVKAYNIWALSVYNWQTGILATLRANGQAEVPALPPYPTLFTLRGVQGEQAWNVDCGGSQTLAGVMGEALRAPAPTAKYLSLNEVEIVTQDPHLYNPEAAPALAQIVKPQQAGLGLDPITWIVIAAIAIGVVSAAVMAIMSYLETNSIEESHSEQIKQQSVAYQAYTSAVLECYKTCAQNDQACIDRCNSSIKPPSLKATWLSGKWGLLQWTGFTVLVGGAALVGYKIWQRKREGRPVFQLPESSSAAMAGPRLKRLKHARHGGDEGSSPYNDYGLTYQQWLYAAGYDSHDAAPVGARQAWEADEDPAEWRLVG